MSGITFLMGIIPPFSKIGLLATVSFILCRLIQSVIYGVEVPGATTFLLEHTHQKKRGIYFGLMGSAIGLGSTLALFIAWFLSKLLSPEQMSLWGFRIPFLLGGLASSIGFLVRKYVPETPAFLAIRKEKAESLFNLNYIKQILIGIGIMLFPASCVTFFLTLPVYLNENFAYQFKDIYLAMTLGSLWTSFLIPIFGWSSDYLGNKRLLLIAIILFMFLSFPFFSLLTLKNKIALFTFVFWGNYFILLPQAFPTTSRCTGTAISYNLAFTLASLVPLSANYIYNVLKQPYYMPALLFFLAAVSAMSTYRFQISQQTE
jgi:MHS family proline/betaine transporter-like MFS transporter